MPAIARPRLAALVVAGSLLLAGCGGTSATSGSGDTGFVAGDGSVVLLDAADRAPAPDLRGTTLDGEEFVLGDHRGEVVVVNVWASWCAPCRAEAPALVRVARDLEDDGLTVVGLNTRDSQTSANAFVETYAVPYPNIVDADGRLQLAFRDSLPPQAIPSTLVIDRDGRVAGRILGRASESALRGLVEPLLRDSASTPVASGSAS